VLAGAVAGLVGLVTAGVAAGVAPVPAYADGIRNASWQLQALRIAEAHKLSQGEGVTVALIDTGVDLTHPDLKGAVLPGASVLPAQRDPYGHGTAMATLIAGRGHGPGGRDGVLGIAPKAKILPYGISPPGVVPGAGDLFDGGNLVVAIRKAVDAGADIINISLTTDLSPSLEEAVDYAWRHNVLVIAAAGNISIPVMEDLAQVRHVVSVSSSDRSGKRDPAHAAWGPELSMLAPGVDLPMGYAAGRQYVTTSGTSAATAIATGTAALIRAKYPLASVGELSERLQLTTTEVGPKGWDEDTGWGIVNPVAALTTEPREVPKPASSSAAPVADPVTWDSHSTARDVLYSIAGLVGVLVVLAGIVVAVVVWVRRRRRRAAAAPSGPGPPAPPPPTGSSPWARP